MLLDVFGTKYGAFVVPAEHLPEDELGSCDRVGCVIKIQAGLTPARFVDILLHECLHAALWQAGHAGRRMDEEDVCTVTGRLLASLFTLNPGLPAGIARLLNGELHHVGPEDFARTFDR